MTDFFPRQIAQINDFSGQVGQGLIDLMGKQPQTSTLDIMSKMVNQAINASESQKLTEAVDSYNRAMEAGKSASEALQGIDSRIAGSKAFQTRADQIRESVLRDAANKRADRAEARAQALMDEQFRITRQAEDAQNLEANLINSLQTYGNGYASIWMEQNKDALAKNPKANLAINTLLQKAGISTQMADGTKEAGFSTLATPDVQALINQANRIRTQATLPSGLAMNLNPEDVMKLKDDEATISNLGQQLGIDKSADMQDLREIWYDAKKKVLGQLAQDPNINIKQIPPELINAAMLSRYEAATFSFLSDHLQGSIDTNNVVDYLKNQGATYAKRKREYDVANKAYNSLVQARDSHTFEDAKTSYDAYKTNQLRALQEGRISQEVYNRLMNAKRAELTSKLNSTNEDVSALLRIINANKNQK